MNCEGNCNGVGADGTVFTHEGDVSEVMVTGWGSVCDIFNYCEAAIAADRRNGFTVEIA